MRDLAAPANVKASVVAHAASDNPKAAEWLSRLHVVRVHAKDRNGHPTTHLDLAEVEVTGHDTCALEEDFFSYRRKTKRNEPDYGRQVSVIGLT